MKQVHWLHTPLFAKWYVTNRCNLRCRHCYLDDYTLRPPLGRLLDVADELSDAGVRSVAILGGEPLTRDDLELLMGRLTTLGITTRIATNGMYATPERVLSLIEHGASAFQVSLEGATAEACEAIRGPNTFPRITAGVEALVAGGACVTLAYTMTAQNYRQLPQCLDLAEKLGVSEVKLAPFIPTGSGAKAAQALSLTPVICREIVTSLSAACAKHPGLKIDGGPFLRRIAITPRATQHMQQRGTFGCGAGTTTIIINSDLSVSACDMRTQSERTTRRLGEGTSLADIWRDSPLFARWRDQTDRADFAGVHQHGCHLAYQSYGKDLFGNEAIRDER
ncbi:coenzyme PQQ synthesis protein E [Pandoraea pneumonica]|uniref:Coenzyme PQQ synthesis protein E n=1 Tax=Pandoraea pneumonica TaxID=2508299 RepID=A0A5E4UJL9_9BURK|nr:radical SAM protein [Pandoraea pneumonica]VVE00231.1 coenzyme PQQ synthesis protein E [Pandoraea pneumonica]